MQCNSCLVPNNLKHNRQYREELEERDGQDIAAHVEAQQNHNFIRDARDNAEMLFRARTIMF